MKLQFMHLAITISGLMLMGAVQCEKTDTDTHAQDDDDDNNSATNDDDLDTDDIFDDDDDDNDNNDNDNNEGDTDPNSDYDGDGFTDNEGDCNDGQALINPDAVEDLGKEGNGDGADNDCDGEVDEVETCDTGDVGEGAEDLAAAINLCDKRFLLDVEKKYSSVEGQKGYGTISKQGDNNCIRRRQGKEMLAISTGPVGQKDPNDPSSSMGAGAAVESLDPQPNFQGNKPTTTDKQPSVNRSQLILFLKAPSNATGFSFDFLFGSAEYAEWINRSYNDTFYAILEYDAVNGGETTNIAFDNNHNEIEVDTNFFENDIAPCDESGSGWEPEMEEVSGSTGWLRTSWEIEHPGDRFKLTFSIHDEGDWKYDSIAFIDNFRWHTTPVDDETIIIVE